MWVAVPAPGGCLRLGGPTERRPALAGRKSKAFVAVSAPDKDTENWVEATSGFFDHHTVRWRMRYEALQSETGKKLLRWSGRDPDDISSMVLVEKERAYSESDAVLRIMHHIDLPFPQLVFFLFLEHGTIDHFPHEWWLEFPEGFHIRQHREQSL